MLCICCQTGVECFLHSLVFCLFASVFLSWSALNFQGQYKIRHCKSAAVIRAPIWSSHSLGVSDCTAVLLSLGSFDTWSHYSALSQRQSTEALWLKELRCSLILIYYWMWGLKLNFEWEHLPLSLEAQIKRGALWYGSVPYFITFCLTNHVQWWCLTRVNNKWSIKHQVIKELN